MVPWKIKLRTATTHRGQGATKMILSTTETTNLMEA